LQRRFHNGAAGTFVATQSIENELHARGFERLMRWSRGVDTELFRPRKVRVFGEKPVFLYVGRIAVEKNIKAFLDLDLPGRKVLVGSGPQAAELARTYPDALFAGPMEGQELARAYASSDVFVFPSLTDTFGLVLLEALATGVPVAAFPASGPKDVLTEPGVGALDWDLKAASLAALSLDRRAARAHALVYSWENSARQFIDNVLIAHHRKLPERRRRWRRNRQKKTARLGGNRAASLSCVSLGDAWGISRPPKNG
jgi:1,2-diacylglycerol 3-alpha-glucosyltransferase/glucuronosyltransferase